MKSLENCLEVLRGRKAEDELAIVQRQIEAVSGSAERAEELRALQARKRELREELRRHLGAAAP